MPKTAAIILIGNEILSGKISDANAAWLCRELRALGVDVRRVSVIADEVAVVQHPALVALLRRHLGAGTTDAHLKMAEVPAGAELVDDSRGFPTIVVGNVYILPGVPEIFRQKFETVRERFR